MSYKTILVHVDDSPHVAARIESHVYLAEQSGGEDGGDRILAELV